MQLLAFIWIADISSWNLIQRVSCCALPGLYVNHWYAFMKSHLASKLLCPSWDSFESLICSSEILSSLWVIVHLLTYIWITDMPWPLMKSYLGCEFRAHLGLHLNFLTCFYKKSHSDCELLYTSWTLFELLTCLMKYYPDCELLCILCTHLNHWYTHLMSSRLWVVVHIWVWGFPNTDMSIWNFI